MGRLVPLKVLVKFLSKVLLFKVHRFSPFSSSLKSFPLMGAMELGSGIFNECGSYVGISSCMFSSCMFMFST